MKTPPKHGFLLTFILVALSMASLALIPSCSSTSFAGLKEKVAGYDTAKLAELFAKTPYAQEFKYKDQVVKILALLKKDGTTETVAVTEDGEVVDKDAVVADAAK